MPRSLSRAVVLTDDLDAAIRFLSDVANVAPVSAVTAGGPEDTIAEVVAGGVAFELIQFG